MTHLRRWLTETTISLPRSPAQVRASSSATAADAVRVNNTAAGACRWSRSPADLGPPRHIGHLAGRRCKAADGNPSRQDLYTGNRRPVELDGSGNWTLRLDSDLADNTYDVVATATDEAGNSASDRGFRRGGRRSSAPAVRHCDTLLTRQRQPVVTGSWPWEMPRRLRLDWRPDLIGRAGDGLAAMATSLVPDFRKPAGWHLQRCCDVADKAGNAATDESDAN